MINGYRQGGWWSAIPPVTKNLIIINIIVWLAEILVPGFSQTLVDRLGLHLFGSSLFNPAQLFTYMFMHDARSPMHILFNMFSLWMFGRILEQVWGGKRFLTFYLVCGVGAALVQEGVWELTWKSDYINALVRQNGVTFEHMEALVNAAIADGDPGIAEVIAQFKSSMVTIGASGAIYGILLGFAFTFPDMPLYLFFIPVPIKAKYMVIAYGVIEFFLGVSHSVSSVAHFAHLGGMLFGILLLLYWKKKGTLHRFR